MMVNSATSVNSTNQTYYNPNGDAVSQEENNLGKQEFLELLVTQLKYQDPTSPMDNNEFISQLATFSSLEQMTLLNEGFKSLQFLQASSLVGKVVEGVTPEGVAVMGTVDQVETGKDGVLLHVDDKYLQLSDVARVLDQVVAQ